jgi:type IV conjugative transfer system protein TraL
MSSDYDTHVILHHLDDPLRILNWTLDEAVFVLCSPYVGIMVDAPWLGTIVGILGTLALKHTKRRLGAGTLAHALYWYLPTSQTRSLAASHMREYGA